MTCLLQAPKCGENHDHSIDSHSGQQGAVHEKLLVRFEKVAVAFRKTVRIRRLRRLWRKPPACVYQGCARLDESEPCAKMITIKNGERVIAVPDSANRRKTNEKQRVSRNSEKKAGQKKAEEARMRKANRWSSEGPTGSGHALRVFLMR